MRYWDSPAHRTPADTEYMYDQLRRPGPRRYFVWDMAGEIVGAGGIHARHELGFILHPDHWGKGLAREGAEAAIAHFWATTDAPRLTASADPDNLASVGLLTRLGFRVTGFRKDAMCVADYWSDDVYLELRRPGA